MTMNFSKRLLLFTLFCFASCALGIQNGPSYSFSDDLDKLFDTVSFSEGVPLRRTHHHHLHSRGMHHEMFEPKKEIALDYLHHNSDIQTLTFASDTMSYVNLETLETHGRISNHTGPICSPPDEKDLTTLHLDFNDYFAFKLAKQYWNNRTDLLFVIEDESCFEEEGQRSAYHAQSLSFIEGPGQPIAVRITAKHLALGPEHPETASTLELTMQPLSALQSQTPGYTMHHRLLNRGSPAWWNKVKNVFTHDIPSAFKTRVPSAFKTAIPNAFHTAASSIVYVEEHISDKIQEASQFNIDSDMEIHISKNVDRKLRYQPIADMQKLGWFPQLTFINSYASVDLSVFFKMKFQILPHGSDFKALFESHISANDKFKKLLGHHLIELEIGMRAMRDLKVGLQIETYIPGGIEWFCYFPLLPEMVGGACVPVATLGGVSSVLGPEKLQFNEKALKDPPKGAMGFKALGVKMLLSNGFGIWTRIGAHAEFNFTTPGIDIMIPRGQISSFGFKNSRGFDKKMHADLKGRDSKFDVDNSKFYVSAAIGPRVTLGLGLPGTKAAFNAEARIDMPKLEVAGGQLHDVDKLCRPNGIRLNIPPQDLIKDAWGIWLEVGLGLYANVVLPVIGTIIDTNWLGHRLHPELTGLMWTNRVLGRCWGKTSWDQRQDALRELKETFSGRVTRVTSKFNE